MVVEHIERSAEVNMYIITFKVAPNGFSPYFTLVGHTQNINEGNNFGGVIVKACNMANSNVVKLLMFKN